VFENLERVEDSKCVDETDDERTLRIVYTDEKRKVDVALRRQEFGVVRDRTQ
jgi:hypothetical protein